MILSIFLLGFQCHTVHRSLIGSLVTIPGLGEKKARLLLERFWTLQAVAVAREAELAAVVGVSVAKIVFKFFNDVKK